MKKIIKSVLKGTLSSGLFICIMYGLGISFYYTMKTLSKHLGDNISFTLILFITCSIFFTVMIHHDEF